MVVSASLSVFLDMQLATRLSCLKLQLALPLSAAEYFRAAFNGRAFEQSDPYGRIARELATRKVCDRASLALYQFARLDHVLVSTLVPLRTTTPADHCTLGGAPWWRLMYAAL